MTTATYNCTDPQQRAEGLAHAQRAIAQKQCVVIPTDTVYGIAADAFSAQAVATLLAAKGRGRSMPPPVLIPRIQTMDGLATEVPAGGRALAEKFWPGPLTLILHAQPSLTWDLGETKGTVALRIPDDELAQALLTITGPLAVSSANRSGQPAAQTAEAAREQLAESVEVYLDEGLRPLAASAAADGPEAAAGLPSTIVDCTGERLRVVRQGALALDAIRAIVPDVLGVGEEPEAQAESEEPGATSSALDLEKGSAATEPAAATEQAAYDEHEAATEPAASVDEPAASAGPENLQGQPRD